MWKGAEPGHNHGRRSKRERGDGERLTQASLTIHKKGSRVPIGSRQVGSQEGYSIYWDKEMARREARVSADALAKLTAQHHPKVKGGYYMHEEGTIVTRGEARKGANGGSIACLWLPKHGNRWKQMFISKHSSLYWSHPILPEMIEPANMDSLPQITRFTLIKEVNLLPKPATSDLLDVRFKSKSIAAVLRTATARWSTQRWGATRIVEICANPGGNFEVIKNLLPNAYLDYEFCCCTCSDLITNTALGGYADPIPGDLDALIGRGAEQRISQNHGGLCTYNLGSHNLTLHGDSDEAAISREIDLTLSTLTLIRKGDFEVIVWENAACLHPPGANRLCGALLYLFQEYDWQMGSVDVKTERSASSKWDPDLKPLGPLGHDISYTPTGTKRKICIGVKKKQERSIPEAAPPAQRRCAESDPLLPRVRLKIKQQ